MSKLFKNMATLNQVKTILSNLDLKSGVIKIGGEPSPDAAATAKISLFADVRIGEAKFKLDLRDVVVEAKE